MKRVLGRIILFGTVYAVVGIAFPNPSVANRSQFLWRLGAWLICAFAFGLNVLYEHFRLRNSPLQIAFHSSISVALGALALAIAANIHALQTQTGNQSRLLMALLLWPIITTVPSFLVSLTTAFILDRIQPKRPRG